MNWNKFWVSLPWKEDAPKFFKNQTKVLKLYNVLCSIKCLVCEKLKKKIGLNLFFDKCEWFAGLWVHPCGIKFVKNYFIMKIDRSWRIGYLFKFVRLQLNYLFVTNHYLKPVFVLVKHSCLWLLKWNFHSSINTS